MTLSPATFGQLLPVRLGAEAYPFREDGHVDNDNLQKWTGVVGTFVGGILTALFGVKLRIARQTRKPVTLENAIDQVRNDILAIRRDFTMLRDVTIPAIDKRVATVDVRTEADHREIMQEFNRMNEALITLAAGFAALRKRLQDS